MEIGKKLKTLREERGLTQIELSKLSGVSERSIRNYEKDDASITISVLEKIAEALKVDISYFFEKNVHKLSISCP